MTIIRSQIPRPISVSISGVPTDLLTTITLVPTTRKHRRYNVILKNHHHNKCALKFKSKDEAYSSSPRVDVQKLVDFLYEDLPNVFGEKGIDSRFYDDNLMFTDPITKHHTLDGYLFNISMLKLLFTPKCQLHWVKQTGEYEIRARWTMKMKYMLLPWKPNLVFTGTSVMTVDPATGKFSTHVDTWDCIKDNDYFSVEGLWEVFRQMMMYQYPDSESPKYRILKITPDYEVRKYGQNQDEFSSLKEVEGHIVAVLKFSGKSTENNLSKKARDLRNRLIRDGLTPRKGYSLTPHNLLRNELLIWLEDYIID